MALTGIAFRTGAFGRIILQVYDEQLVPGGLGWSKLREVRRDATHEDLGEVRRQLMSGTPTEVE